jgi:hypothetical protein
MNRFHAKKDVETTRSAESEMDTQLRILTEHLAKASPADDISDADIQAEIEAGER